MKDYRLSDIVTHCKKMHDMYDKNACDICSHGHYELSQFCLYKIDGGCPNSWDNIEQRDMIELPCKQKVVVNEKEWWFVYLRMENGFITNQAFELEEEADEFLQELKNGKV